MAEIAHDSAILICCGNIILSGSLSGTTCFHAIPECDTCWIPRLRKPAICTASSNRGVAYQ